MASGQINAKLELDFTKFNEAVRKLTRSLRKIHVAMEKSHKHRARCSVCSPMANPLPLTIDGAAYRRRNKARGRRK